MSSSSRGRRSGAGDPRTASYAALEGKHSAPTAPVSSQFTSSASNDDLFVRCHPDDQEPSFVFVCLGVGGGPLENDCSCYLVKAADRHWRDGSFALEGGSWLGALSRVCEDGFDAFHDFDFTHSSPSLRAGEIGTHTKAFLISHAHLDHVLGMVLGSASLPGKRAVYGLKSTLDNLMGLFDGKLWPKLASFKEDAPHIVYHMKPLESQNPIQLDDSLSALPFALSHGLNVATVPAPPTPTQFSPASSYFSKRYSLPLNSLSLTSSHVASEASEKPTFTSPFAPAEQAPTVAASSSSSRTSSPVPGSTEASASSSASGFFAESEGDGVAPEGSSEPRPSAASPSKKKPLSLRRPRRPKTAQGSEKAAPPAGLQGLATMNAAATERSGPEGRRHSSARRGSGERCSTTLDSTAFFLTHKRSGNDVLFFGDVEPDCVSRSPRNRRVWQHAASRFAVGRLHAVFLECSYPAAQPTEFLWGHLSTNHLFDELVVLARCVRSERAAQARKSSVAAAVSSGGGQAGGTGSGLGPGVGWRGGPGPASTSPSPAFGSSSLGLGLGKPLPQIPASPLTPTSAGSMGAQELRGVLRGLTIVIVHVKQALFPSYAEPRSTATGDDGGSQADRERERVLDPRSMQERVLQELEEREQEMGLGVRFIMSKQGMRIET